jgi:hypothetical protein
MSARHSNRPALPDQLNANFVITGMKVGAPVPPATSDVPPPRISWLSLFSELAPPPAAISGAAANIASTSVSTASVTRDSLLLGNFN